MNLFGAFRERQDRELQVGQVLERVEYLLDSIEGHLTEALLTAMDENTVFDVMEEVSAMRLELRRLRLPQG